MNMFPKTKIGVVAVSAALALTATSVALAASSAQTYSQKFTVKRPGRPSGVTFQAAGPVQADSVTLTFPAGTKINTAALKRCTNPSSCPIASRIGSGTATASVAGTALPALSVAAYNRATGMVLVVSDPLGPVVLKPSLTGRTLNVALPALSVGGQPITITSLRLTVSKIGSGGKAYITTPKTCPASGGWMFSGRFTYPNAPAQVIKSRSACTKH
jgi:hypothetical protein